MNQNEIEQILQYLQFLIQKAGNELLTFYDKPDLNRISIKAQHDFVSDADRKVEAFLYNHLFQEFPDFDFLCEESIHTNTSSTYRWIIDPLDGTTNFLRKIPIFAISIALESRNNSYYPQSSYGERIIGVVYNPVLKQLWYAGKGVGAFYNGTSIRVNHSIAFQDALLATGFPFRSKYLTGIYIQAWQKLFEACSSMRRCGAASIDMCWVASGNVDGFWELNLSPWDIAAGEVIVREAGGIVGSFSMYPDPLTDGCIWCSAPQLYEQGLLILKSVFGEHFTPSQYFQNRIDNQK